MGSVAIEIDKGSLAAMQTLGQTMLARMRYMKESAQEASHALMLTILKSLKPMTKVAKLTGLKPKLQKREDLVFSYTATGKMQEMPKKGKLGVEMKVPVKMCVRNKGGVRITGNVEGKMRFVNCQGVPAKTIKCFTFIDAYDLEGTPFEDKYLIVAPSTGAATKYAKTIISRRILRYVGLARRAISALMAKLFTGIREDGGSPRVTATAYDATRTLELIGDGQYTLEAHDNLRYATDALKGGSATVDLALRKAVNKIVGQISHRFKNKPFFDPTDLPQIFPEVRSRRSA